MIPVHGAEGQREPESWHGKWYALDTPYQRLELFSSWAIAGFGLAVCLALVLVYPHRTLEESLTGGQQNSKPDRLTIEYLKVFLKAQPTSLGLRAALVDQLVRLGSFGEAREAILPMLQSSNLAQHVDAQWLELNMREQEAFAAGGNSAARQQALHAQLSLLSTLPQDSQHLLVLGRKALAFGSNAVAARAFEQLAARPEILTSALYAEAARATLGIGNYTTAADLYFRAMRHAGTREQRRDYFMTALRTLQAGGLYEALVPAADRHLGPLADDTQTLLFLARLARASNQLDAAERYAKRLLQLSLLMPGRPTPDGEPSSLLCRDSPVCGTPMPAAVWQTPAQFYAGLNRPLGKLRLLRVAAGNAPAVDADAERGGDHSPATGTAAYGPRLPFDEEAYALSYEIFLANRNQKDARRVAEAAVRLQPDNAAWRKRLAQVEEWSGDPAASLPHWLAFARLTGDETVWDRVLALAIGLADATTELVVIHHRAAINPDNPRWLDRLVQIHEMAGQPERALALLRSRIATATPARSGAQRAMRLYALELLAGLAERTGQDAESLATLERIQDEYGPRSANALRIADQYYRSGQPVMAFRALNRATAVARDNDAVFWRAYAGLAGLLQDDAAAASGLRHLLAAGQDDDNDRTSLITLLEADRPRAAAQLAEFNFARTGEIRYAALALSLRVRLADWPGARALLAQVGRLPPAQQALLEKNPNFLAMRSAVAQAGNDVPAALRDTRAALALRPDDMELRAGLIWLLIAARDGATLKQVLPAWAGDAERSRSLWDAYAAAMMSMNRQGEALHWFRKSGFQRNDYLWLMSYAEALDATAQSDLAWRIRRRVWTELRRPERWRNASPDQTIALRDRLVALAPLFMDGDGALRVLQALLRADVSPAGPARPSQPEPAPRSGREMLALLDRPEPPLASDLAQRQRRAALAAPVPIDALLAPGPGQRPLDDARMTASARELALAYALSQGDNDLAAAWFASRFADQIARPVYAILALALQADDRAALDRLLDDLPDWLPVADRIEASQRAGRPALAQSLAFDQLLLVPNDDALHLRLTNLTTALAPAAGFSSPSSAAAIVQAPHATIDRSWQRQSPLSVQQNQAQVALPLSPGLAVTLAAAGRDNASSERAQLAGVPRTDRDIGISLQRQLDRGTMAVTLTARQASGSTTGLRLDYNLSVMPAVSITGGAELRQMASESVLLRLAGMRSGLSASVLLALGRAEYARLGIGAHRYATQAGTALGSGVNWNAEIGSHLRIAYPNLTLRAYAAGGMYRDSGQADAMIGALVAPGIDLATYRVLPQNDTLMGLSIGVGTVTESIYSRAWRPYAELGTTYSRILGPGYNMRAGVVGSVLGQDLMRLRGLRASGTATAPQGLKEFGLDYNWFF